MKTGTKTREVYLSIILDSMKQLEPNSMRAFYTINDEFVRMVESSNDYLLLETLLSEELRNELRVYFESMKKLYFARMILYSHDYLRSETNLSEEHQNELRNHFIQMSEEDYRHEIDARFKRCVMKVRELAIYRLTTLGTEESTRIIEDFIKRFRFRLRKSTGVVHVSIALPTLETAIRELYKLGSKYGKKKLLSLLKKSEINTIRALTGVHQDPAINLAIRLLFELDEVEATDLLLSYLTKPVDTSSMSSIINAIISIGFDAIWKLLEYDGLHPIHEHGLVGFLSETSSQHLKYVLQVLWLKLQEKWVRPQHDAILRALEEGYHFVKVDGALLCVSRIDSEITVTDIRWDSSDFWVSEIVPVRYLSQLPRNHSDALKRVIRQIRHEQAIRKYKMQAGFEYLEELRERMDSEFVKTAFHFVTEGDIAQGGVTSDAELKQLVTDTCMERLEELQPIDIQYASELSIIEDLCEAPDLVVRLAACAIKQREGFLEEIQRALADEPIKGTELLWFLDELNVFDMKKLRSLKRLLEEAIAGRTIILEKMKSNKK